MEVRPVEAGFSPVRLDRISTHLQDRYITPGKIKGAQVMVSRRGVPAYFRSFGEMDAERGKPVEEDTIFRIYSMTKPITSVALMMLFEEGHFQLNDPVSRFIPAWADHEVWVEGSGNSMVTRTFENQMTVKDLLCHTSGLTYGGLLWEVDLHPVDQVYQQLDLSRGPGETTKSFIEKLANVPLRYEPGKRWRYSLATDVCGCLVEIISGQSLPEFFRARLFEPLGMADTAFSVAEDKQDRFAANYERNRDKTLRLIDDPATSSYLEEPTFPSGGGGLVSTTSDYARFCEMLRRGGELDGVRIVGDRTLKLMHMNHLPGGADLASVAMEGFTETAYEGIGFGLGFASTIDQIAAGNISGGDYYWGGAASTIFWIDPVEDLFVIFMTQLMPSATFNFRGQLKNIIYSSIEA